MAAHPLNLDALVEALDAKRKSEDISWRELARQSKVSPSTLTRMQNGQRPDVDTFSALVQWLGASAEEFLATGKSSEEKPPEATFAALMRSSSVKKLSAAEKGALDALSILSKPKR